MPRHASGRGVVFAAFLMHLCLGGVYAWSSFVPALRESFGYSVAQTQLVFGLTITVLCLAAIPAGRLQDLRGPRMAAILSGILIGAGYLTAGFFGHTLPGLIIGVSVLCGIGVALGYLPAIATAAKWFPARKGMAAGIVLSGYGLASILLAGATEALLSRGWGVLDIYKAIGMVYGVLVIASGLALRLPEKCGTPEAGAFSRSSLWKDRRFWRMSVGIFCATYPGLAIIGAMKPIGLWRGFTLATAVAAISFFAVGNGFGRVVMGHVHDRLEGRGVIVIHLAMVTVSVILFGVGLLHPALFLFSALLLGLCYGGSLSVYPAEVALAYGVGVMGTVYPMVLLSHGVAGFIAAPVTGLGFDLSGAYWPGIGVALTVGLAGTVACSLLGRERHF